MKRARAPNFTAAEVMDLLNLIEKYPAIECKKTDAVTAKDKNTAWQKLADEYNSRTNFSPRTAENLQACYKNQKVKAKKIHSNEKMAIKAPLLLNAVEEHGQDWERVAQDTKESSIDCQTTFTQLVREVKKEEASHKREMNRTGGGPPPGPSCSSSDPVLQKVKTLIGPCLEGVYTVYDGDAEFMHEQQVSRPIEEQICPVEYPAEISLKMANDGTSNNLNKSGDFKRLNIMKKKIDPSLETGNKKVTEKKNKTSDTFQQLAEDKQELVKAQRTLVDLQIRHQTELFNEQLQFEKKKNNMELDLVNKKLELVKEKLQFEKKKNEMKLDLLKQNFMQDNYDE